VAALSEAFDTADGFMTRNAAARALGKQGADGIAALLERLQHNSPDLPIIAGVMLSENVGRIQKAGVDSAISLSQVAGQLLARHVLGETVLLQPRIKLVKTRPGPTEGKHPHRARIRERTDCSVVAVERNGDMLMDYPPEFRLSAEDALFICGTAKAVSRYYEEYPASRL